MSNRLVYRSEEVSGVFLLDYLKDLVQAAEKALEDKKQATLDRERLKKAERVGPGCAEKIRRG